MRAGGLALKEVISELHVAGLVDAVSQEFEAALTDETAFERKGVIPDAAAETALAFWEMFFHDKLLSPEKHEELPTGEG